ncbi:hypothetical protein JQC67_04175 [Aurantibacter crassamenti]|uniref:hypothetical protein n=1 Tax=Aurantibacter crassamenti TaxID=1837375 RepID=UPI00193A0DF6|nr:hypothetical protein [Aurantibacter crassamenti]MBM1105332.1 hypothetical protein [Aurantibacter crassamenti]
MKKLLYSFLFLVLFSCSKDAEFNEDINSSEPIFLGEIEFIKSYGGSGTDTARSIISTNDGGFAILGFSNSTDGDISDKTNPVVDYWVLKLDALGDLQWSKTYGGSGEDIGQSIMQTSDGGYVLTGYAQSADGDGSNNEGFHDNWIIRLDSQGTILWEKSFGFSGHDHSYDIIQTDDGGLFFTGFLDITAAREDGYAEKGELLTRHGVGEFWGTKLDANGNVEWRKYFGGSNNDRSYGVVKSNDGGFVLAGFTESNDFDITINRGSYDFWIVKIDQNGGFIWEHAYGGSGIDRAYDIVNTHDGGYAITGQTISADLDVGKNNGESDIWMIKLNDEGELQWENSFGGSRFELAEELCLTADNGFMIIGNSKSTDGDAIENAGENDIWAIRTDANGQLEWQKSIGGTDLDYGFDVIENQDGSIMLVGETLSQDFPGVSNKGMTDAVLIKIK